MFFSSVLAILLGLLVYARNKHPLEAAGSNELIKDFNRGFNALFVSVFLLIFAPLKIWWVDVAFQIVFCLFILSLIKLAEDTDGKIFTREQYRKAGLAAIVILTLNLIL